MSVLTERRVPGVYFLPPPVRRGLGLPPLDVAAFVGFAEKGPVDLPVPVGDINAYRAIFGGDLALAYEGGERTVYANLPQSVASFFSNGGRRCYVVRVVGKDATEKRCQIPHLAAIGNGPARLVSGFASSKGSWSAGIRLATRLDRTPMPLSAFALESTDDGVLLRWDARAAPTAIQTGDLLTLTFGDGRIVLFPVTGLEREAEIEKRVALVTTGVYRQLGPGEIGPGWIVAEAARLTQDGQIAGTVITGIHVADGSIELSIDPDDAAAVSPGDVLQVRIRFDGERAGRVLFPVASVRKASEESSPPNDLPGLRANLLLSLDAERLPAGALSAVERLRFDLALRDGDQRHIVVSDLAFNQPHPAFWGDVALLGTSELRPRPSPKTSPPAAVARPAGKIPAAAIRLSEKTPEAAAADLYRLLQTDQRIDPVRDGVPSATMLAGMLGPVAGTGLTFLPLDMPGVLTNDDFVAPAAADVGRDGLDQFDADSFEMFVHGDLALTNADRGLRTDALLSEAFDLVYLRDKRLRGLHSLLFVDEVAMVSLPEAGQRNWTPAGPRPADAIVPVPDQPAPEPCPPPGPFLDCERPPVVTEVRPTVGSVRGGTRVTVIGDGFEVFVTKVSFDGAAASEIEVVSGSELRCTTPTAGLAGLVTVEVETSLGVGSKPNGFRYLPETVAAALPEQAPLSEYSIDPDDSPLLPLQRELVRFCQARADVVAMLTLPRHFEKRACIEWQQELRGYLGLPRRGSSFNDVRDIADLSYATVYHPWLLVRDALSPDAMRAILPDGAVCGMVAARERARQVWVAPANVPLEGVLGLTPNIGQEDWADLFEAQFNLVRSEPIDFRAMSAHTLSDEAILLQFSVRRLMILLRKVAYLRGLDFVFESNHERFREGVRAVLSDMLRFMFERGAFAGRTPDESYRVVTDESVNPPESVDLGRFIALVQVAPSQPAEFITVVLSRAGDQLQLSEA
jgi:hypothetical protein